MKTILAAAALALGVSLGAPAFASSEAPVMGTARSIAAPAFVTAGAEGAPVFATARPDMLVMTGAAQALALTAEAYPGKRG
ncbi:MAG: hypothetical protein MUC64_16045 [Rubritepida sp.]|jgi:hypothetical protein|nr:hypothetical protein [Rubritepida sp.]